MFLRRLGWIYIQLMKFNAFLKECQDKEVFKKLSIYAVFSWLFIQVVAVLKEPIGLPGKAVTYTLILLLLGFPFYIFCIWKFQIAPIHKQNLIGNGHLNSKKRFFGSKTPFQRYYFLSIFIISSLVSLILFFVIRNNFFKNNNIDTARPIQLDLKSSDKIGVLKFGNNTGKDSLDIVGKMAADWIIHGITQKNLAQVVSPQIVEDYTNIIKASLSNADKANVLQDYFKPAQIISGNYYLSNGNLIFQCSIIDGKLDKTLLSLEEVKCDSTNPLDCIEELKQRILGYLITADNNKLNLQEIPPKYEAYELFLEAKNASTYDENTINLIEKAIAIDPEYFEPRTFQITYYYDQGEYKKADSLLKNISINYKLDKRQENIVQLYAALLEGNNRNVYRHVKREYDIAPFDLNTNASMLAVAVQFVNKPQIIDTVFSVINTKDSDAESCFYCSNRIYVKAQAELELKHYDSVLHYSMPVYKLEEQESFLNPMIAAYLHLNRDPMELIDTPGLRLSKDKRSKFLLYTGTQSLILQKQAEANAYFDDVIAIEASPAILGEAAYYRKDFKRAIAEFTKVKEEDSLNLDAIGFLANAYAGLGESSLALQEIALLKSRRDDYQFGKIDYLMARYYTVTEDDRQSLAYLNKAVAAGFLYTLFYYQHDPHFIKYFDTPEFNKIMNYWY